LALPHPHQLLFLKMALPSSEALQSLITNSALRQEDKDTFSTWAIATQARLQQPLKRSEFSDLLNSIPVFPGSDYLPVASLALIISQSQGPLPSFDIIKCYTRLWMLLPETSKAGQNEASKTILQDAQDSICLSVGAVRSHFTSNTHTRALIDPETHRFLTHQQVSNFIHSFALPLSDTNTPPQPTVAIGLPQGYLVALACLAVSSYYTAAPLNIAGGAAQFRSEVELAGAQCVLVLTTDVERLGLKEPWVTEAGIQIILVSPNEDMTFQVHPYSALPPNASTLSPTPNSANDLAMILFTSGTSGKRKVVPITCMGLLTGVQCVIDSWDLTSTDTCVNMMPLNHVGGIVRNLFAPVMSGGATILCQAFDPNLFWDLLEVGQGTWYYASPSMHMSILVEAGLRGDTVKDCHLRLVCNAAGGLLPALAARLRDTFGCTVLPSYGMTECMPISTPPINYTLDRVGTSGIGCGPEIAILDDSGKQLTAGEVGRINVRSGPTFPGYLLNGKIDTSAFTSDGWFDTGDLGSLDKDGYLYLTGRGKEVINRGGEIISPFEIEEAITIASQDPNSSLFGRISQVLAFSAPHEVLQEVVGVALVIRDSERRPDIRDLHSALKSSLHSAKLPVVLVYMEALPTSNNKLVRIRFAERMGMKPINNETTLPARHFEATCPPLNSSLTTKIINSSCEFDLSLLLSQLQNLLGPELQGHVGVSHHDGTPVAYLAPREAFSGPRTLVEGTIEGLSEKLRETLHGLLIPSSISFLPEPYPRQLNGAIDEWALQSMLTKIKHAQASPATSETEQRIRKAFAEVLNFPIDEINSRSDFFALGGESLSAGHLLSLIRRDIGVRIPVDKLFTSPTVFSLCSLVDNILQVNANVDLESGAAPSMPGCTETYSSTNPLVLIVHALPIVLLFPMKMAFQWTALMYALSTLSSDWFEPNIAARFVALITAMFASRLATQIFAPLLGIAFKWLVIGKYREGMYPMWGPYHTRWWIVDKMLRICGKVSDTHP
jgi:acyl-CoA synthetase (AMP-forming)/AMP-acid ligase II/acyl carrier protein